MSRVPFHGHERGGKNPGGSSRGRSLGCAALRMESEESQRASICCFMPMYLTEVTQRDGLGAVGPVNPQLFGAAAVQTCNFVALSLEMAKWHSAPGISWF